MSTPTASPLTDRTELTWRGLVLGVLITVLFTAANVYFGLRAGLTFATSIPAAVISMAVLRGFQGMTVQENNIVQTVASAAGTLSAIIFVLPGLVMIGWWTGFPYWTSFAICALGGTLGVMYSIPLRRALVTQSDLPYPDGVASGAGMNLAKLAQSTLLHQVRLIGAGAIGISAVWTLAKLVKPVAAGLRSAMAASKARASGRGALLPRTEQDIPIGWVALISLVCMVPIAMLLTNLGVRSGLGGQLLLVVTGAVIYIVLMGFFVSAVCGYMAGLIGASNSPLSGIGILAVIGAALLLLLGVDTLPAAGPQALVAFAPFVTAVVLAVASIANHNLQGLRTGQLVDATPLKQQVALVIGVLACAAIIPPLFDVVNQ